MSLLRSRIFLSLAGQALTLESLKADPVVPGVSVITVGPARGHFKFDENDQPRPVFIDAITLQQVMACAQTYEGGLRVNAGHFTGVLDAAAFLTGYRIEETKLRADMTLFETFEKFEHLCRLITSIPDTFGLSIDFSGPPEFRDGQALARCVEIYSADLVPVPAANDRGLFGSGYVFCEAGKITTPFDTPKSDMTLEELSTQLTDAVNKMNAATTKFTEATAKIDGAVTKVGELETKFEGANSKVTALETKVGEIKPDESAVEAKRIAESVQSEFTALTGKLANRLGLEFAARAGAKPTQPGKKDGEGDDTRKSFEIPASEKNTEAVRTLLGSK